MEEKSSENQIYLGDRGEAFRKLIISVLEIGRIKSKYIDILTSNKNLEVYSMVFTSASANPDENYEVFEQIGDLSINKFIVSYMYRRFPQLNCPQGVKIVARLRINYGSKDSLEKIADKLGFWNFISSSVEDRNRRRKHLLEDVLEAFIGATEMLLDKEFRPGVGYAIVYDILKVIFNQINISLRYEDMYDAKTRLKELFDWDKNLGDIEYSVIEQGEGIPTKIHVIQIVGGIKNKKNIIGGTRTVIGEGVAPLKSDAEQKAALKGLIFFQRRGIVKPIPEIYNTFCT